ncbi:MAG: FliM/FliN family flagellar motor switch protein [Verrucomicrobiales bacterium]|nr:FliM/FliN family flagellar motor switch protein [Verrucomicrobiales bacterium]
MSGEASVLSQSDVERLLSQVQEEQGKADVLTSDGRRQQRSQDSIQPYDFRQPAFLSARELRKLRLWHEEFIRSLASRLSTYLRLEVGVQMAKLQTITYQKFLEILPNPTYITLFKADPMRGVCVLELPLKLGLTIVDRLLGGSAMNVSGQRDMTEIEVALLDQALQIMLAEWCNHWNYEQEIRPVLLGHETNGRFLQTAASDTVMLHLSIEAHIGDCVEPIQLGFPYYTLEPLVLRMNKLLDLNAQDAESGKSPEMRWHSRLDEVVIPVTAEWLGNRMSIRELSNLKPGDTIPLSPECEQHVTVRLANIRKFEGSLGTMDRQWAIQVKQVLPS